MRIVQIIALAVLAMIPLSAFSGPLDRLRSLWHHRRLNGRTGCPLRHRQGRHGRTSELHSSGRVTRAAMGGPANSTPANAVTRAAMGEPANSTPANAVTNRHGRTGGHDDSIGDQPRVLGGPIEELIKAVVDASHGTNRAVLEVCPSGCAYSSIQDAIDDATSGDEVLVHSGTYGGFEVEKQITVRGHFTGSERPVVNAGACINVSNGGSVQGLSLFWRYAARLAAMDSPTEDLSRNNLGTLPAQSRIASHMMATEAAVVQSHCEQLRVLCRDSKLLHSIFVTATTAQ